MSDHQSRTKIAHVLNSPYLEPSWPAISANLESNILDLLIPILSRLSQHRTIHVPKTKRRKRKRHIKASKDDAPGTVTAHPLESSNAELSLQQCLTIGFNSTVQLLEALSQSQLKTAPPSADDKVSVPAPFAVLVCRDTMPAVMTAPLPQLAVLASRTANLEPIRLVSVSQNGAKTIAEALKLPRASIIGIRQSSSLLDELQDVIRTSVKPIDVPWLREMETGIYQPLQIDSKEIPAPQSKQKGNKRKHEGDSKTT